MGKSYLKKSYKAEIFKTIKIKKSYQVRIKRKNNINKK